MSTSTEDMFNNCFWNEDNFGLRIGLTAIPRFLYGTAIGALVALASYHYLVGPVEPIVLLLWVAPMGIGLGFLFNSKAPEHEMTANKTPKFLSPKATKDAANTVPTLSYEQIQYKDMGKKLRFLFSLWIFIGWLIRTAFFLGFAYLISSWVLPNQILDVPFSDWSLRIVFGVLASTWVIFVAVYWINKPPELRNYHTLANNHYSHWFIFAGNVLLFGALIWFFFFDGRATVEALFYQGDNL